MIKKIYELTLMTLLIVSIFYLGFTNKLKLLINPRYFIFIYITLIILFIFICILILSSWEGRGTYTFKSSYLLMLLMVFLMFTTSYTNFQNSLAGLKGISLPSNASIDEISNSPSPLENENKENTIPKPVIESTIVIDDINYYDTIDRLYNNINAYAGTEITIKGFVSNFDDLDSNHFVLSRMIMICCAADSSVCGLICDISQVDFNFHENMWYEITGSIEKQNVTINSYTSDNPVIVVEKFTPIEPLEDPYIYPNFF